MGCNARKEITCAEFALIRMHKSNLIRTLEIEERFDIVLANYVEFEKEILDRAVEHNLFAKMTPHQMHEDRTALNRRITNLLSSCRLYLDQLRHSIKAIYGEGAEFDAIEKLTNIEYDKHFSYRLMEAMRNFVQHRGLAASSYSISHQLTDLGNDGRVACTVTPQVICKDLENDPQFKATVKDELRALPNCLDLKPYVREYIECLWRIHSGVRSQLSSGCLLWEQTLRKAIDDFKNHLSISSDDVPVGLAIIYGGSNPPYTIAEKHDVFLDFIERRKYMEKRNVVNKDLSRRFVTGQESSLIKTK